MFDISLTDEHVLESGVQALYGKICVGEYSETFIASLVNWSVAQYQQHWEDALQRIVEERRDSALITSYVRPDLAEFLIWWPLYLEGELVYVRNELLLYSQLSKPFVVDHPWGSLRPRQILNPEGLPISEWAISVQSIRECLSRLHARKTAGS